MTDVVDEKTRSRMMSGIKGKNTKPEILIRKGLFAKGLRYRLHAKSLPGKPDVILPKYNAAIQIHGCFWHVHGCAIFKWPSNNAEFWKEKLSGNRERDAIAQQKLMHLGWRLLVIWECASRGPGSHPIEEVIEQAYEWILSDSSFMEIRSDE